LQEIDPVSAFAKAPQAPARFEQAERVSKSGVQIVLRCICIKQLTLFFWKVISAAGGLPLLGDRFSSVSAVGMFFRTRTNRFK
jgi:hypothetical protein